MKKQRVRAGLAAVALCVGAAMFPGAGNAQAVDYSLPSLWSEYSDDFIFGTFGNWSNQQQLLHYRGNSPANALKLDSQIGSSNTNNLSRQAYVAAVAAINADETLDAGAKAAAIELANQNVVLQATTSSFQSEGILKAIQAYNAANNLPEAEKKVVRAHVLAWHGGQQPNYFFADGFTFNSASPNWATPETMLKRLDNYIKAMMAKYAPYNDIIYSWDVVNEPIDDYTGQIRNSDDAQVGQWGTVFRRRDLDGDPDARLYAESVWVRQAFASARKWSDFYGADWTLYFNDFQDSNKLYEPKLSQSIKMLKPIYEAGNIDGYGMQGRLSWAYPSIAQLRAQIDAGLTVADEIIITEGDIRSDFEPNPDYDPTLPTRRVTEADGQDLTKQWPTFGSCSWVSRTASNGNTLDVCNSPVRRIPAWGTGSNNALASSPEIMQKQADFAADWMDLLLSYGDKIVAFQIDGTNDNSTFNRNTGGHLWSGLAGNPEKYSFFSVLGAPGREDMRDAIAVPVGESAEFTPQTWQAYSQARAAAEALVGVRIYDLAGVQAVKSATSTLEAATQGLTRLFGPGVDSDGVSPDGWQNAGFFQLVTGDLAGVTVTVTDTATGTSFGPYPAGSYIKLTTAPGASASSVKPGDGAVDWHFRFAGDALITVTDATGTATATLSVPPRNN